jgi:hypothetical protein
VNLRVNDPEFRDDGGRLRVQVQRVQPPTGSETVTLDSTAVAGAQSARIYQAGQRLRVHASGTYRFSSSVQADAECSSASYDPTWRVARQELNDGSPLGDVTVDGQLLSWTPDSGSSSGCDGNHGYWLTFTPSRSGTLAFALADADLADNAGRITLTVQPA